MQLQVLYLTKYNLVTSGYKSVMRKWIKFIEIVESILRSHVILNIKCEFSN